MQKLPQAVDPSCRGTYTSHIHVCMLQLSTATKITTKEGNVRYLLGEHLLEVYSVHQHGEGESIEKEIIEMQ